MSDRKTPREAVATAVNDLTDSLDEEGYPDEEYRREMVENARETLSLLLERDDFGGAALSLELRKKGEAWTLEATGDSPADAAESFEEELGDVMRHWTGDGRPEPPADGPGKG